MRSSPLLCLPLLTVASAVCCGPVVAQVVQLPVIRNFSVSGSALVPDGGTASLGGVGYSSGQSNSAGWGPYATRARSGQTGGASVAASATIIDLAALDEAILAQAGVRPRGSLGRTADEANANMGTAGNAPGNSPRPTGGAYGGARGVNVAASAAAAAGAYQDSNARQSSQVNQARHSGWLHVLAAGVETPGNPSAALLADDNLAYYLRKAREAEQVGRPLAAKVYYSMLLEKMDPKLRAAYFETVERRQLEQLAKEKDSVRRGSAMKF